MRISSVLLVLLAAASFCPALAVSGHITRDTTWSNATTHVGGDITIDSGVTLTIEGHYLTVRFSGYYAIAVKGRIVTDVTWLTLTASDTTVGWAGLQFDSVAVTSDSSILQHCIIEYARASGGTAASGSGGGVYVRNFSKLRISNCRFRNCSAVYDGGAIYCMGASPNLAGYRDSILNCSAGRFGGGIYLGGGCASELSGYVIRGNTAGEGGGLCCAANTARVINCIVDSNTALSTNGGGGIAIRQGLPSIIGCVIAGNRALGSGASGGGIRVYASDARLVNNTILRNVAANGGGMGCSSDADPVSHNAIIWGNIGTSSGPQIYLADDLSDPPFYFCDIQSGANAFGRGAGVTYNSAYVSCTDTDPLFGSESSGDWIPKPVSPCINAGTPDTTGLKLPEEDVLSRARVSDGRIDQGACEYPYQVHIARGNIATDTTWSSTTVFVASDIVVNDGVTLTINPGVTVSFEGHFYLRVAGRLLARGEAALGRGITFTAGDTTEGWQGLRFLSTPVTNDSSILEHCLFKYGRATGTSGDYRNGGALFVSNMSKLRLSHCRITSCSADYGAAVYCVSGNPTFVNNEFSHCRAVYGGGALYCNAASPRLIGCLLHSNSASTGGAIACVTNANPQIVSSTITSNSATYYGGALHCMQSDPTFRNTILWGNTAEPEGGHQVYLADAGSDPSFAYCDVQGWTYEFGGSGSGSSYGGAFTNNTDQPPEFNESFNFLLPYFSLLGSSACRNNGDPDTASLGLPSLDIAGNPRLFGGAIDIGAYEHQQHCAPRVVASDTTWQPDTVFVYNDVAINDGATLTIAPRVVLCFMGKHALNVQGRLLAIGTATDSIRFTNKSSGNSRGVRFASTPATNDSSVFAYCVLTGRTAGTTRADSCGGALYISNFAKVRVSHCRILGSAHRHGGGVYCADGGIRMHNSFLRACNAGRYGGGVYGARSTLLFENVKFDTCWAYAGGGVYLSAASPTIVNSIVLKCNASSWGGAIACNDGAAPQFLNCSIVANTSYDGGGLAAAGVSPATFRNSIVYYNRASYGDQISFDYAAAGPSFYYCDLEGLTAASTTGAYEHNMTGMPLLSWNMALDRASPCIDAGTPDTSGLGLPATDYAGNARICRGRIDIGAVEYQNSPPVLQSVTNQAAVEDSFLTLTMSMVNAADVDEDSLFLVVEDGDNYTVAGAVLTPAQNFTGDLSVPVRVSDGFALSNVLTMTITVADVLDPPAAPSLISPASGDTVRQDSVRLVWNTAQGLVSYYWVEYATDSTMTDATVDSTVTDTSTLVESLVSRATYWWRVRAGNAAGWGPFSDVGRFAVLIPATHAVPREFGVRTFGLTGGAGHIRYALPRACDVHVQLIDMNGQVLRSLTNRGQPPGYHSADLKLSTLASGKYLFLFTAGEFSVKRTLQLVR